MLGTDLIIALHGVHTSGADGGWIGPIAIVALVIVTLALASHRAKK